LFLTLQACCILPCLAQLTTITGHVLSEDGKPVPGATITAVGASGKGTNANDEGTFTLQLPAGTKAIQVSAVGMVTQQIPLAGQTSFEIILKVSDRSLNQVVVTALGIRTRMLSGDARAVADSVAGRIGIAEVEAPVRPEDKVATVARLRAGGARVAMVGDGINDAPALAEADLGIAMGGGTDVAMAAAAITLMRPDPRLVADALAISRATWNKVRQNLFWAFAYNVVGLPLAAFGLLNPALAGAAMALSSISVVGNALLLRRWRPRV